MELATKEITAQNQFTDWLYIKGDFAVSIVGTVDSTVTVQRRFTPSDAAADVDTFTAATETNGYDGVGAQYRIGVKTGDFGSNTINVTIRDNDLGR